MVFGLLPIFSNSAAAAAALPHMSTRLRLIKSAVQVSAQAREYGGEMAGASKRTIENVRQQAGFTQPFMSLLYGAGAPKHTVESAARGADLDPVHMVLLSQAVPSTPPARLLCMQDGCFAFLLAGCCSTHQVSPPPLNLGTAKLLWVLHLRLSGWGHDTSGITWMPPAYRAAAWSYCLVLSSPPDLQVAEVDSKLKVSEHASVAYKVCMPWSRHMMYSSCQGLIWSLLASVHPPVYICNQPVCSMLPPAVSCA